MSEFHMVKNIQVYKLEHNKLIYYSATCISGKFGLIEKTGPTEQEALNRLKDCVLNLRDFKGRKNHAWPNV